ncbi:MAG: peptide deformylase [Actinomycetota bacterium]|nr:peptide deformylase [Actinomycetota bacterium]
MAIFPVRLFGDPVLREKSHPVRELDKRIQVLSADMAQTMYKCAGVGLAAPQIGVLKQIITIDMDQDNYVVYLNPEIKESSRSEETEEEGCLCVPHIRVPVTRARKVIVKALDLQGRPLIIEAEDLLARILQHEIDHLHGQTILDKTDAKSRRRAVREFMENGRQEA